VASLEHRARAHRAEAQVQQAAGIAPRLAAREDDVEARRGLSLRGGDQTIGPVLLTYWPLNRISFR
jgi:hypothetical protein